MDLSKSNIIIPTEAHVDPFGEVVGRVPKTTEHEPNIFTTDGGTIPKEVFLKPFEESIEPVIKGPDHVTQTVGYVADWAHYDHAKSVASVAPPDLTFDWSKPYSEYKIIPEPSIPEKIQLSEEFLNLSFEQLLEKAKSTKQPPYIEYKYNEDLLLDEMESYINSTYTEHYSGKYQATDMIIDAGHGTGFCMGNILKYAKRYGKKDGYNRKDLLKIIHYAMIQLYNHDTNNL